MLLVMGQLVDRNCGLKHCFGVTDSDSSFFWLQNNFLTRSGVVLL